MSFDTVIVHFLVKSLHSIKLQFNKQHVNCVSTCAVHYLTLDLSSSRIQTAALGHTSTPFCFVIRQLLGFFPGQVHLSEVPFDDIYQVPPRSSWLSLVTSQFPVCCLTSCSRVVHSQDVSQPPEPSFFKLYLPVSLSQFSFWCLHFWPCPSIAQYHGYISIAHICPSKYLPNIQSPFESRNGSCGYNIVR